MKTQVPGSRLTMTATPGDDLAQFMNSISSCHVDDVGTFLLYSPRPTHYMLVHEKSATMSHAHNQLSLISLRQESADIHSGRLHPTDDAVLRLSPCCDNRH